MISDQSYDGAIRQGEPPIVPARYPDEPPRASLSKRLALMFLAFAVIGIVGAAINFIQRDYWPRGGISRYNYRQIQLGMTDAEVEEIIGLPPGTHRTRQPIGGMTSAGNWGLTIAEAGLPEHEMFEQVRPGGALRYKQWWGTYHAIGIAIDANGIVIGKYLIEIPW